MGSGRQLCRVLAPSPAQLLRVPGPAVCPHSDCGQTFRHANALFLHVTRHHGRAPLQPRPHSGALYICPVSQCDSGKSHFASFKALKQHYMKCHALRTHMCSQCGRAAFASEALLRAHRKSCRKRYGCECGAVFAHKSTLTRHTNRHNHRLLFTVESEECHENDTEEPQSSISSAATGTPAAAVATSPPAAAAGGGGGGGVAVAVLPAAAVTSSDLRAGAAAATGSTVRGNCLHALAHTTLGQSRLSSTAAAGAGSLAPVAVVGRACQTALTVAARPGAGGPTAAPSWPGAADVMLPDVSRRVERPASALGAAELLSAQTQTLSSFDDIEHLLLPVDETERGSNELPLFPELSAIDCYTQTDWQTIDQHPHLSLLD